MHWQSDRRILAHNGKVKLNVSGFGEVDGMCIDNEWFVCGDGFPEPIIREFISSWRYDFTGCGKNLLGYGRDESIIHDNPEYENEHNRDRRDL